MFFALRAPRAGSPAFVSVFLSISIFGFPNSDFQNIWTRISPRENILTRFFPAKNILTRSFPCENILIKNEFFAVLMGF